MVCKLVKKTVLASAAVVGGLALVNGVWHGSVPTFFHRVSTAVGRNVSPEFELERIDHQIAKLTPDLHKHIEKIAEETVAVQALERQADAAQVNLTKRKTEMLALADQAANGTVKVGYGTGDLKKKLDRDFKNYKVCERDLESKQKLLAAKKQALESAKLQLTEITTQQNELMALREQYRAEWEALKLEQARSTVKLDDSRLGEIKASLERVRQRIDVERQKIDLTGQFVPTAAADGKAKVEPAKDIVSEVRGYLTSDKPQAVQD